MSTMDMKNDKLSSNSVKHLIDNKQFSQIDILYLKCIEINGKIVYYHNNFIQLINITAQNLNYIKISNIKVKNVIE